MLNAHTEAAEANEYWGNLEMEDSINKSALRRKEDLGAGLEIYGAGCMGLTHLMLADASKWKYYGMPILCPPVKVASVGLDIVPSR